MRVLRICLTEHFPSRLTGFSFRANDSPILPKLKMAPPPPPQPQCDIFMQRCNIIATANCVKCQNGYIHHASFGITSCSNLQAIIFWSCKTRSTTFTTYISALDRISAMEKKIECVNSRIRDFALLQNEVASLRKLDSPFMNADKTGFHRNRIESSSSSQIISGSKKRKAEEFVWNLHNEN